jgi:hypothetical protein
MVFALQTTAPSDKNCQSIYSDLKKFALKISTTTFGPDILPIFGFKQVADGENEKAFGKYEQRDEYGVLTISFSARYKQSAEPTRSMSMTLIPVKPTQVSQEVLSGMIARSITHDLDIAFGKHKIVVEDFQPELGYGHFSETIIVSLDGKIESITLSGHGVFKER